jgi:hypothetical protein
MLKIKDLVTSKQIHNFEEEWNFFSTTASKRTKLLTMAVAEDDLHFFICLPRKQIKLDHVIFR